MIYSMVICVAELWAFGTLMERIPSLYVALIASLSMDEGNEKDLLNAPVTRSLVHQEACLSPLAPCTTLVVSFPSEGVEDDDDFVVRSMLPLRVKTLPSVTWMLISFFSTPGSSAWSS